MKIIYFDFETQGTAHDVNGWEREADMAISRGVTHCTDLHEYRIYPERRINELIPQLRRADLVVEFDMVNFDYQILLAYTVLDLPHQLRTLDILAKLHKFIL